MMYIGIDPGLDGGIAAVEGGRLIGVWDMPTRDVRDSRGKARRKVDPRGLLDLLMLEVPWPDMVVVEKVSAAPGQGVSSAFSFGHGVGCLMACIEAVWQGVSLVEVASASWKPAMRVPREKEGARQLASTLFGGEAHWPLKGHHGRAEAAMIALYGEGLKQGKRR